MMGGTPALAALGALVFVLIACAWLLRVYGMREVEVLSRDQQLLTSTRLGLSGRPDRLVRLRNGMVIPYEMKSAQRLYEGHRIQVAAYLLLVEEAYGKRPPYGVVALRDGSKIKIRNTAKLRRWARHIAKQIDEQMQDLQAPIRVSATPAKCRTCSVREVCQQQAV